MFRIKWCFLKLRCKHLTCWILKMTKYLNFSHFLHHFGMSFVWQFKCDSKVACIKLNFVKLSVCMQSIWQFAHPTRYIHFSLTFTNVFATSSFLHQFNYYTDKPLHNRKPCHNINTRYTTQNSISLGALAVALYIFLLFLCGEKSLIKLSLVPKCFDFWIETAREFIAYELVKFILH